MSREFWRSFIKLYESEPCLWQIKSKAYHDRHKKDVGYSKLTAKLKEIDSNATKDDVIKKINNIRSAYRKEKKKVKASAKSAESPDGVYTPKLWYFTMLSFLNQQGPHPRTSRANGEDDAEDDNISGTEDKEQPMEETTRQNGSGENTGSNEENSPEQPRVTRLRVRRRNEESVREAEQASLREDRFDVIGKMIAMKLRGLPKLQMLIAEKLIHETLFQGEIGCLTLSHSLVGETVPQQFP